VKRPVDGVVGRREHDKHSLLLSVDVVLDHAKLVAVWVAGCHQPTFGKAYLGFTTVPPDSSTFVQVLSMSSISTVHKRRDGQAASGVFAFPDSQSTIHTDGAAVRILRPAGPDAAKVGAFPLSDSVEGICIKVLRAFGIADLDLEMNNCCWHTSPFRHHGARFRLQASRILNAVAGLPCRSAEIMTDISGRRADGTGC
jgi:hypothetical protein